MKFLLMYFVKDSIYNYYSIVKNEIKCICFHLNVIVMCDTITERGGKIVEFLQLKYFSDAAQTENFSKTAQKYGVPTSAVSQSIRRLEKELGTELFDRRSNRIALNGDGRRFYMAVCRVDDILKDAREHLIRQPEELRGEIRVNILCNRRVVSDAIKQFAAIHPKVSFVLNHGVNVAENYDLVISDESASKGMYVRQALITEDVAIAFSKDHPLAKLETVELSELAEEHFVSMTPNNRLHDLTRRLCAQAGFSPQISIQCDDPFYIRKYIEMGLGIGFVPLFSWQGQLSDGLVWKKLEGVQRTTYAYWDGTRTVPAAVKAFLELLAQLCKEQGGCK